MCCPKDDTSYFFHMIFNGYSLFFMKNVSIFIVKYNTPYEKFNNTLFYQCTCMERCKEGHGRYKYSAPSKESLPF